MNEKRRKDKDGDRLKKTRLHLFTFFWRFVGAYMEERRKKKPDTVPIFKMSILVGHLDPLPLIMHPLAS